MLNILMRAITYFADNINGICLLNFIFAWGIFNTLCCRENIINDSDNDNDSDSDNDNYCS